MSHSGKREQSTHHLEHRRTMTTAWQGVYVGRVKYVEAGYSHDPRSSRFCRWWRQWSHLSALHLFLLFCSLLFFFKSKYIYRFGVKPMDGCTGGLVPPASLRAPPSFRVGVCVRVQLRDYSAVSNDRCRRGGPRAEGQRLSATPSKKFYYNI